MRPGNSRCARGRGTCRAGQSRSVLPDILTTSGTCDGAEERSMEVNPGTPAARTRRRRATSRPTRLGGPIAKQSSIRPPSRTSVARSTFTATPMKVSRTRWTSRSSRRRAAWAACYTRPSSGGIGRPRRCGGFRKTSIAGVMPRRSPRSRPGWAPTLRGAATRSQSRPCGSSSMTAWTPSGCPSRTPSTR